MWCVVRVGVRKVCYVVIFIGSVACCAWKLLWLVYACEWVYGAEWVMMEVVLLWRFGLAVAWGVVFCEVCNRCGCGCEGGCGITVGMVDGGVC